MSPKFNDWCPYKEKEIWRHTHIQSHMKTEAEIGVLHCSHKPRIAGNYQNLEEAIRGFRGSMALVMP